MNYENPLVQYINSATMWSEGLFAVFSFFFSCQLLLVPLDIILNQTADNN